MKKLVIRNFELSPLEKVKYEKLADGWKVKTPPKKGLVFWKVVMTK